MATNATKPLRLALRVEGGFWNAYIAEVGTMNDALLIGCIPISAARKGDMKDRFMSLMQDTMVSLLADMGVHAEDFEVTPAPISERGGRA